ncbi:hypothetical protein Tco_0943221, partial [Tanacetum coccineum]
YFPCSTYRFQVLAQWNAIYDADNEDLKFKFEKQAGVEMFDLIQTFQACKQEEGKLVGPYVITIVVISAIEHGHVDIPESHGEVIRWLDDEIPRNRIPTLRRDLLGVVIFLRWVEAEWLVSRLKMRNGEDFSYFGSMLPLMYQLMAVKKTSFPKMEYSGSVVASIHDVVEDQNKALSDT